eukprot:249054-Chlamydomonas_euryale.AAC.4
MRGGLLLSENKQYTQQPAARLRAGTKGGMLYICGGLVAVVASDTSRAASVLQRSTWRQLDCSCRGLLSTSWAPPRCRMACTCNSTSPAEFVSRS